LLLKYHTFLEDFKSFIWQIVSYKVVCSILSWARLDSEIFYRKAECFNCVLSSLGRDPDYHDRMLVLASGHVPLSIAFPVFLADITCSSLYSCYLSVLLYLNFNLFILTQMYDGFVNLSIPLQKVLQFSCQSIFCANRRPFVFQKCLFSFTVFPFKQFSFSDYNYLITF
jgi:hypothetical protein